jgi:hypothetical protein
MNDPVSPARLTNTYSGFCNNGMLLLLTQPGGLKRPDGRTAADRIEDAIGQTC